MTLKKTVLHAVTLSAFLAASTTGAFAGRAPVDDGGDAGAVLLVAALAALVLFGGAAQPAVDLGE